MLEVSRSLCRGGGAGAGGGGGDGGPCMRGFVLYTLSAFLILPGGGAPAGGHNPDHLSNCQEKLTVMQVQELKGLRM